ncbi:glutamine synthetase family protein [Pararhodospirillum oryzae]|uniref:Glutamine synthetase n=1 Tax=Pararhodospirillum oryzae TaxID=478448 RepID=A0A512H9E6_9PROT|nr:glutamine synthetase family protein [Pararhodospirillum oryzae]GEO82062.1 glutamine synthetase [Pararhodospirillum oryzae]
MLPIGLPPAHVASFFHRHPEIEILEAFVIDVNGVPRGKWIPRDRAEEVLVSGIALPRSVLVLDVWGRDVDRAGLASGTGDPDGLCLPVEGSLCPMPWVERPMAQVMLTMADDDGQPFFADSRQLLDRVLDRYRALGLTPVVATELEFYLIDRHRTPLDPVRPPKSEHGRWQGWQTQVLSVTELHDNGALLADIAAACRAMAVPADSTLRENGPGQYEINLKHVADALAAADHAVMLKRIVRGVAARHGLDATFMAKPYGDHEGSGMHIHFSVLDQEGNAVFASAPDQANPALRHAVAGVLDSLGDCMLLFAPHNNSYRRLWLSEHSPTVASWGYDNRNAAVRVVTSSPGASRLENRVPGADVNPYLAIAGLLASAHRGLVARSEPPPPARPGDPVPDSQRLPALWERSIERFATSTFITEYLGARFQSVFVATKRQELDEYRLRVTDVEYDAYLRTV